MQTNTLILIETLARGWREMQEKYDPSSGRKEMERERLREAILIHSACSIRGVSRPFSAFFRKPDQQGSALNEDALASIEELARDYRHALEQIDALMQARGVTAAACAVSLTHGQEFFLSYP